MLQWPVGGDQSEATRSPETAPNNHSSTELTAAFIRTSVTVSAIKSARLTGSQPQTETRDTNRVKLESSFFLFSPFFSEYLASRLSLLSVIHVIPTFQGMRRNQSSD